MATIPPEQRAKTVIARAQIHSQVSYAVAANENGKAILLAAAWLLMGIWLEEDKIDLVKLDLAQELIKAVSERGRYRRERY